MNRTIGKRLLFYLCCLSIHSLIKGSCSAPQNAFIPYDPLLIAYRPPQCLAQLAITCAEFGFHTTGFMDTSDDDCGIQTRGNVLQIWQKKQDAIAAFKRAPADSPAGQAAQLLNLDDDTQSFGQYTPCAEFSMPLNLGLAARFGVSRNQFPEITFAAYIPYRIVQLKNIRWRDDNPRTTFEEITAPDLLTEIERIGDINLHQSWTRHGFGDLLVRAEYNKFFIQRRPWLRAVNLALRGGVIIPTGLPANNRLLYAEPLGYGGGFGMHASGMLMLCYQHGITLGLDGELLHLFGTHTHTRVKIDPAQTDLLLITKIPVFREPGFIQRFTLLLEKSQNGGGLTGTVAYQYFKKSDDFLFPCVSGFDNNIINNAESLQESTAHSFVLLLSYDWAYNIHWRTVPSCAAFLKIGFNGKRSLITDSAGFTLSISF